MIGTFCLGEESWLHLTLPSHPLFLFSNEQVAFTHRLVRRAIFQIFLIPHYPVTCHPICQPATDGSNEGLQKSPATASNPSNFRILLPCSSCEVKVWKTLHRNHGLEAITQLGDCCFTDLFTVRWETGARLGLESWSHYFSDTLALGNLSSLIGTYSLSRTTEN